MNCIIDAIINDLNKWLLSMSLKAVDIIDAIDITGDCKGKSVGWVVGWWVDEWVGEGVIEWHLSP